MDHRRTRKKTDEASNSSERTRRLRALKRLIDHVPDEYVDELENLLLELTATAECLESPSAEELAEELRRLWNRENASKRIEKQGLKYLQ